MLIPKSRMQPTNQTVVGQQLQANEENKFGMLNGISPNATLLSLGSVLLPFLYLSKHP